MEVVELSDPGREWDDFVRTQHGYTPFHLSAWRDVIREVFGHQSIYLTARSGSQTLGALSLVRVKSPVFGHFLVSMPFVNYGGPLGTPDAIRALTMAATDRAVADRASLLQLRSRIELPVTLAASHHKITVVLGLKSSDPAQVFKQLDSKLRSQIRRPQKAGATVTFGVEQLDPFFDVFSRNMRDLGTPTQSRAFFRSLSRAFGDDLWFGCVYIGGRPVAAGCGFRWDDEFEMTWASALREFNSVSPNMLLYWAFIERAASSGVKRFNFGRCTPGSGTHRFKKQWGGADEALWWYSYPGGDNARTPSPDRGAYALAARMWSRLPLAVATRLGPRIVRFIP